VITSATAVVNGLMLRGLHWLAMILDFTSSRKLKGPLGLLRCGLATLPPSAMIRHVLQAK
jgi:hypothetical protein